MKKTLDSLLLIAYCGLIFGLSGLSQVPAPSLFAHQDKAQHFLAYFVMAVLAWRACRHLKKSRRFCWLVAGGFCSLYGVSDEWHQAFVPGREASAWDWLADNIGILSAMACLQVYVKRCLGRSRA